MSLESFRFVSFFIVLNCYERFGEKCTKSKGTQGKQCCDFETQVVGMSGKLAN